MLAMPGLRAFSLAEKQGSEGVSFDTHGVFAGGVPLLEAPDAGNRYWGVRPAAEINKELAARYRLPIDIASKAGALALIATALNRGDVAMAAIAAVQMQIPDPPPLAKHTENADEIAHRAQELFRSGLLKFWDPAKHPRAGVPPNAGWFTLVSDDKPKTLEVVPNIMMGNPADKPWDERPATEGGRDEEGPPGVLELPLPGGAPEALWPGASPARPPAPERPPRGSWRLPDPKSKLPFMGKTEPQLAPYKDGGPTSGIFKGGGLTVELQSGYNGPSANLPEGSLGFDGRTMTHVEAQAAALMQQEGISEATLYINNPEICERCTRLLKRMLPSGATLNVILPNDTMKEFTGIR